MEAKMAADRLAAPQVYAPTNKYLSKEKFIFKVNGESEKRLESQEGAVSHSAVEMIIKKCLKRHTN